MCCTWLQHCWYWLHDCFQIAAEISSHSTCLLLLPSSTQHKHTSASVYCGGLNASRALTLLVGQQVLYWLSDWSEVQMTCIWSSWCHCHPVISCFSKIQNSLSFWYWLTQVVLKKAIVATNAWFYQHWINLWLAMQSLTSYSVINLRLFYKRWSCSDYLLRDLQHLIGWWKSPDIIIVCSANCVIVFR